MRSWKGPHTGTITHTASSTDSVYQGLAVADVTADITDNDTAGVLITPSGGATTVSEGGVSDDYTVVLTSVPTADVTITVTPDAQLDLGAGTGVPLVLTFTPANALTPQTVTVTAVDDAVVEGPHTGTITHTASSTDSVYQGLAVADVTADITDNDTASLTIADVTQSESLDLLFTVTLDNSVVTGFDVFVTFLDMTATGGPLPLVSPEDYANDSQTITFVGLAGEEHQFSVPTLDDLLLESSETFTVQLASTTSLVDATDTATGTIVEQNNPPSLTLPSTQVVTEDAASAISGISVSDPDAGIADIQLSLTVNQGTLSIRDDVSGGLVTGEINGNGTSLVILNGSVAKINSTLADPSGLLYQPAPDYSGPDTLTLDVDDLGHTGTGGPQSGQGTVSITVSEVNDPPLMTAGTVGNLTVAEGSGTTSLSLGAVAYAPGGGSDETSQLLSYAVTNVPPTSLGDIVLSDGITVVTPGPYSLPQLHGMQFRPANAAFGGPGEFRFSITDDGTTAGINDPQSIVESLMIDVTGPYLRTGVISSVTNTGWTTVTLDRAYSSMVVVLTANHDGAVPLVTRMRNANPGGNTFEVRVDRVDGLSTAIQGVNVHYVVVEEGVYTLANHGVTMEAVKFTSTVTDSKNSWLAEQRAYGNTYAAPVVIGQVMSYNDPDFSTFWSRGATRGVPPNSTNLFVGKHVGEDIDIDRAAETLGYIVIESGTGTVGSIQYAAQVGVDSVRGVVESPPYSYTHANITYPIAAAASQAGVDGTDGSWALLYGNNPVDASSIQLAVDEDQLLDTERKHTTERVAYVVFGATGTANAPPSLTAPSDLTATEDIPLFVTGISVTDADAGASDVEIQLNVNQGTLTINDTVAGGLLPIDISGNGTGTVTMSGTLAQINTTMANASGLVYLGDPQFNGTDTLTMTVNDLGNTGLGGPRTDQAVIPIVISAVNDAPLNSVPGQQTTNEDTPLLFSSANSNAISVSDVDVAAADMLIALSTTNGTISLAATAGLTFLNGDGVDDAQVMFTGNLIDINSALDGLTFVPDADYFGLAFLQLESNDLGNVGGGQQIAVDAISIDIAAINDAPAIVVPGLQSTLINSALQFETDINRVFISDIDAGVAPIEVTLIAIHGRVSLSNTLGLSLSTGTGTADTTVTFSGALSDINSALDGMFFMPDLDFIGQASLQILVTDNANTGIGGALSDDKIILIDVTP